MITITKAAIKYKDKVYTGTAHWQILDKLEKGIGARPAMYLEGFTTNEGEFVGRVVASDIAYKAGQIDHKPERLLSNMIRLVPDDDVDNTVIQ